MSKSYANTINFTHIKYYKKYLQNLKKFPYSREVNKICINIHHEGVYAKKSCKIGTMGGHQKVVCWGVAFKENVLIFILHFTFTIYIFQNNGHGRRVESYIFKLRYKYIHLRILHTYIHTHTLIYFKKIKFFNLKYRK